MDDEVFAGILKGARQALEIAEGKRAPAHVYHVKPPKRVDVRKIRKKAGMTQKMFALTFGIPERTLKSWESGEREPERMARILLKVIEKNPQAVLDAVG